MSSSVLFMSVSLDGYVAGPNDSAEHPGGDGFTLHDWGLTAAGQHQTEGVAGQMTAEYNETGAVVTGRRTAEQAGFWGGNHHGENVPILVLSHQPPTDGPAVGYPLVAFVADVADAMAQAKAAAGGRDVMVHGGAGTVRSALEAGVLDELQLHQVPVLMGGGRRLFEVLPRTELDIVRVVDTPHATHIRYRIHH
jgi:dihydrofolate reductase